MKRAFDFVVAAISVLALAPLLAMVALVVKAEDGGPTFYRQERVGRGGRTFRIWKFRSMRVNADRGGPAITAAGDARITRIGVFLRKWKFDELPQLFNVLTGEMSLVGPRPEVPRYVALYTPEQRKVLELRPGITDIATIEFRDEETLLARASDAEEFYREHCMPRKIAMNLMYAERASFWSDLGVILRTAGAILRPSRTSGRGHAA